MERCHPHRPRPVAQTWGGGGSSQGPGRGAMNALERFFEREARHLELVERHGAARVGATWGCRAEQAQDLADQGRKHG
eukprot:894723-Alexandrium_andersonii.AAC.1